MFSALKKLVGSEQAPGRDKNIPAGLQSMNQALQRRFAKGVQYNTTDDIVKVEVWDVVDKGKCKKRGDALKMENDPQEAESEMALDAEFLDVYKNCNGVVMMFDITKQWTFNYILRELPKVPTHVPVCVLGNYRDMGEHRVILPDDVRDFIDNLDRPPGSSYFRYAESSMKNSFGLKYLHRFFNIPFLQLQRETLLRQLETNQLDIDATLEELSVQQETEDQNYDIFLEMMEARSRGHASPLATNGQSPSSGSPSPVVPLSAVPTASSSPGTPQPAPQPPLQAPSEAPPAPAQPLVPAAPPRRSVISRLFGISPAAEVAPSPPEPAPASEAPARVQNVEDFVPDDSLDRSFLEDAAPPKDEKEVGATAPQDSDRLGPGLEGRRVSAAALSLGPRPVSDGEAPGGNPMVAGFQDDVDLEDKPPNRPLPPTGPIPREHITLSSEEEEEEAAGRHEATVLVPQKCSEPGTKRSSTKASRPHQDAAPRATEPHWPGGTKRPAEGSSPGLEEGEDKQVSSESDPEGPIAAQMLSFVMDDPDFESDSDAQRRAGEFPVREDLSDVTDEEAGPVQLPPPPKPPAPSFRLKNDSDLFGLGLEDTGRKESSEEDKEGKPPSKEKKKKKKKSREEEEKAAKKKSRRKKSRDQAEDKGREERRRRRGPERTAVHELEAFLGGGAPGGHLRGGGDYEEL
ncbi:rab-like protein 6 isoform X3 [Balaenoptera ricei]|uniref:rab-like protein 6 isoform X3 n=1 Tax=Balaenoptera ricei TaxID=2746895 RepID=UPI0028BD3E55|nr:rab-like protein 6 isoform X3 [Balaenoptera ricei]